MTLVAGPESPLTCVLSSGQLGARLGVDAGVWSPFAVHWDHLAPDTYAAELGAVRLRRYGHFLYKAPDGSVRLLPHDDFIQPENSNPLYIDRGRAFEPLTAALAGDPLLHRLLTFLGGIATTLEDAAEWSVKVTPFRVLSAADGSGDPTPEGLHRDGVTLVSSLLIGRDNATGGQSTVCDRAGAPLLRTTLREPGTMLLGDDRCTLHRVSPIRPLDPARPARRDVLVITFAPYR
ncbi:hypothetical protein A5662_02075 [Mycobacteriaceae bacterium 1482268.1]|nr:hypothetical protein A5662_02075 [Mycobacteriaceae bacterium 1482268.1]